MSIRLSEFISDSWVVISGLRILMIYDASLEIIPAPGTDPVHVFLTKNGKWEGCYCNTSKVLLKSDERFRLLFQRNYYERIFFTCFAKIVWRWCQWMFCLFSISQFISLSPFSLSPSWLEFQIKTFSLSGQNKPNRATRFQFQFLSISYLETLSIIAATQEH